MIETPAQALILFFIYSFWDGFASVSIVPWDSENGLTAAF